MRKMNPDLRKDKKKSTSVKQLGGPWGKQYPTSPVIDKSFRNIGGGQIAEEDVTETLGWLLKPIEGEQTAKTGITEKEDMVKKSDHPTTANGSIISDSNSMLHWPVYIYSSTLCTRWDNLQDTVETEFTELAAVVEDQNDIPRLNEEFGVDSMRIGNCDRIYFDDSDIARSLGEEYILAIPANHHLQIKIEALNPFAEGPEYTKNDTGLMNYEWRFSSGEDNYEVSVMDKVQKTGALLDIPNIQRENIGRYTCHISNKWGEIRSKTIYVHVQRPGILEEETRTIEGVEFPTGTTIFVENLNDMHDEKYKATDDKVVWNDSKRGWVQVYWDFNREEWLEEKDQTKDKPWVYNKSHKEIRQNKKN
jgi:hypothetical protein